MADCIIPQIISQEQAKLLGLLKFYTGKPCRKGHLSERYANGTGICVQCVRAWKDKYPEKKYNAHKVYRQKYPQKMSSLTISYMENNSARIKANQAVSKAKRLGQLIKQNCEHCGSDKTHAHHDNYNFPLDVRWLCNKHHREWHKFNKPIEKNGE